ncbi:MAG: ABC transporter permease subunit [Bermanella sp.]
MSEATFNQASINPMLVIAHKEWTDGRRNFWLQSISVLLFILALGIAYLGGAVAGQVGFTGLSNTIVSLASLAVLIMPLIALLLSYDAIIGEEEGGTLLLLSAYPISVFQLFFGKWLGRSAVLGCSIFMGFGCAALVLAFTTDVMVDELFIAFGIFIFSALLLGMSFLAIGMWISCISKSRAQAAGLSLLLWFFAAVLFDLLVLAILVLTQGKIESNFLAGLMLINPADVFRMINFSLFSDMQQHTGLMNLQQDMNFNLLHLIALAVLWVVAPLAMGFYQFNKRSHL